MKRFIAEALCAIGIHGPVWFGDGEANHPRFERIDCMLRECSHCKARWDGYVEYGRHTRFARWKRAG